MEFAFTEEQQALQQVVRELLAQKCQPAHVRAAVDECGTAPQVIGLKSALAELGVLGIVADEDEGGLGLGVLEACLCLYELGFAGAPEPWAETLLEKWSLWPDAASATLRLSVGTAAQLCGLSRRMLVMAIEHASTREQFGRPIGSFQAVGHHLADVRLAIEFAEPLVWRAALLLHDGPEAAQVAVWAAKHHASEAALLSARKTLQCHGAMGYAHEHDLQLFMKQVWKLAPRHGDPAACRRNIAAALGL